MTGGQNYNTRGTSAREKASLWSSCGLGFGPFKVSPHEARLSLSGGLPGGPQHTGFDITMQQILEFSEEQNLQLLDNFGGSEGIAKLLKVEPKLGTSGDREDWQLRADAFGTNTYPRKKHKPFYKFLLEAFRDTTLLILCGCAISSLIVGMVTEDPSHGWYDGGGISFAILLVVMVSSISDYQQALQFYSLNEEKRKIYLNVTRAGKRCKVLIYDIIVGDVIHLGIGDQIPADGLLLEGHSLCIDESSMTGESEPLHKDEKRKPFLLSGCKVLDGFGTMIVTSVGMNTEWGRLMSTLSEDNDEETPLQLRLNILANAIGQLGLTVAVLVFIILLIRFFATVDYDKFGGDEIRLLVKYFAMSVTILVVAVPEGLPLAVTLTLAYSMHKMMDDNALVRHLSACETMGSATTICSDKTGTLTMNVMTVVKSWVCGDLRENEQTTALSHDARDILYESICFNTNGSINVTPDGDTEVHGSPTESAVLKWGIKIGSNFDDVRLKGKSIRVVPFNSAKKVMGVAIKPKGEAKLRLHWKGASEIVLEECTHLMDSFGNAVPMPPQKMNELKEVIDAFAKNALRTLCIAYREATEEEAAVIESDPLSEVPMNKLICMAIVGIKDPCRPGVPEAVSRCQKAGIQVRMVTGDNIVTAKAIAQECGILTPGGIAIEGKEFRNLTVEQQYLLIPSIQVMARSSPTDKHQLVKRLLEMGEVVAVTGDGTNDAPALHEASIGLAMGIAGTEVAKESSDIIILDDNFASIVKVVRWGRSVYANIQKFLQFQLTVNLVALTINFIAALATGKIPLTAVQLLWVNLIMDTMGALALATEPPTDDLLERPPIKKKEPLITNIMWRNMLSQMTYQVIVLLILQFAGKDIFNLHDHHEVVTPVPAPVTEKAAAAVRLGAQSWSPPYVPDTLPSSQTSVFIESPPPPVFLPPPPTPLQEDTQAITFGTPAEPSQLQQLADPTSAPPPPASRPPPNTPPPPPPPPPPKPKKKSKHGDLTESDLTLITIMFNSFVWCQVFNEINARKPNAINVFEGFFDNYTFTGVILFTGVIQFLIVTYAGAFATTTAIAWHKWAICIAIGSVSIPIAAVFKFVPVPEKPILEGFWAKRTGDREALKQSRQEDSLTSSKTMSTSFSKNVATAGRSGPGASETPRAPGSGREAWR